MNLSNLKDFIRRHCGNAGHFFALLCFLGIIPAVVYRLITGHFSTDNEDEQLLAVGLACAGLIVFVVYVNRG